MTNTATATNLTARQAHHLNRLASTCASLYRAAQDLNRRTTEIAERVAAGQHLEGFGHDVLGQCGREVQHYASMREALIPTMGGCPQTAIVKALTNTSEHNGLWFMEGDEYATTDQDEA